ncbi:MAG TPA: glycosyltransferase family 4 protein [Acetobacteraceae bacterium]|nr:glycosyltransferase family 4 protein [Acetobacteraceae bacterium]
MNVLVWQWGRFGGAPRVAVALVQGMKTLPNVNVSLSMSRNAELMRDGSMPPCTLPVDTYRGRLGFLWRFATIPVAARSLARRIARLRPDVAICAQTGPLDLLMARALRLLGIPMVVLIHDADLHPGDGKLFQMRLQRALCRRAAALGALSAHVGARLKAQGLAGNGARPLIQLRLPPLPIAVPAAEPPAGSGFRLLIFGRLLPYKGLDMLAEALSRLGPLPGLTVRVVGLGPESSELKQLRAIPNVTVENRWVPESELPQLLAWADALVLPYREASQSGVAALALGAGRHVLATRVGGLSEQLGNEPLAILCDPDPVSLSEALRTLVAASPSASTAPAADPIAAWRDMAEELLRQIAACRPVQADRVARCGAVVPGGLNLNGAAGQD